MADLLDKLKKEIHHQIETQQNELQELDIENMEIKKFTPEIAALFSKHDQLETLSLNNCGLTSLEGFPPLRKLQTLILESNALDGEAIRYISQHFKELRCLSLAENKINTFEDLEPLKNLTKLEQLDITDNKVTSEKEYHSRLFKLIPSLQILDNKDETGKEVEFSEDEDEHDEEDDDDDDYDEDEENEGESDEPEKYEKDIHKKKKQ